MQDHNALTKIEEIMNSTAKRLRSADAPTAAQTAPMHRDRESGVLVVEGKRGQHATLSPLDAEGTTYSVGKLVHRAPMPGEMPAGPDFIEVARLEGSSSSVVAALFAGWALDILAA